MPATQTLDGSALRAIIDPERMLPAVTFLPDDSVYAQHYVEPDTTPFVVESGGLAVGMAHIRESRSGDGLLFDEVRVEEPYRSDPLLKGLGTAVYLEAIERAHREGRTFRSSDQSTSSDAVKVWGRFVDKGIASVVEPFVLIKVCEPKFTDIYKGHVAIHPLVHQA